MDLVGFSVSLLLVCFITWIFYSIFLGKNVFKDAGIPHSSKLASLSSIMYLCTYSMQDLILQSYKRHKKIFGQYFFGQPQLTIGDPDLIKQILVKDFQYFVDRMDFASGDPYFDNNVSFLRGHDWKRVRSIMSPGFSTGKIRRMTNFILDSAETLKKNLETFASSGELVDVKRFFGTFTMDAIVSTAFGSKIDSHNDPENPFVVAARKVFSQSNQLYMMMFFFFNSITRMVGIKASNMFGSKFFGKVAMKLIESRKSSGETKNDFLQLLIDARDKNYQQETDETERKHETDVDPLVGDVQNNANGDMENNDTYAKKGVTEDELIAQCIGFFVAGFETVASTLAFAAYELALNEECQRTLAEEIDELLLREKELTYENIQSLKYLDAVVSETLRKHPPALSLARTATSDYMLNETIKIPKGMVVAFPVYGLHYDPDYYPEPEKFLPSRFFPEEKASRNQYIYLPFGAGPRNCIAMRFALFEVKLCLAHLLRSFTFYRSEKTKVPLKFPPLQMQLIAPEILLRIEKRNSKS